MSNLNPLLVHSVLLLMISTNFAVSQEVGPTESGLSGGKSSIAPLYSEQAPTILRSYASPKKLGHYTMTEWRALIDSLWGPGPPTSTKLQIFDFFWDLIDKQYAGFPNLAVNWDSLKAVYRPEIEAGVSRGRLWGIMGHMYLSLQEIHTWMSDLDLDGYFMEGGNQVYKPGIPAFFPSGWGWAGGFGAALTPLPDSSLLVYKALAPHPLGIVPGDIILGYDRIPWKRLYHKLLSVEFPVEWWGETGYGSSPRSRTHGLLNSAGSNWGLFDTVDAVKYATGDTVHLPTAPLTGSDYRALFATEQVSVPGVPMPDYRNGTRVTWGVVDGTSIGYVYVYRWNNADGPAFAAAIRDLITVKKVAGLILDFRYNIGSDDSWVAANSGLDYLFNEDPAGPSRWRTATRSGHTDHFAFSFSGPPGSFQPGPDFYDRPIAVLTGPQTWSLGEHVSFRMRSHPMVRFIGLPTNGAFVMGGGNGGPVFGNWYYRYAAGQMQSLVNNEGFLMHKSFPVDEEVWLTRDGVAKGEDDVVKRALQWINTLSYAHDVQLKRHSFDTVLVVARVQNPLAHTVAVKAILTDGMGAFLDSLSLNDSGLNGDRKAGDSLWSHAYVPPSEALIRATVRTNDLTAGTSRTLTNAAELQFVRGALITLDNREINLGGISKGLSRFDTTFIVRNIGFAPDSITLLIDPVNVDPVTAVAVSPTACFITPGDSQKVTFTVFPGQLLKQYYQVLVTAQPKSGVAQGSLSKSFLFNIMTGTGLNQARIPGSFALGQNYPNPFNPVTTIKYELPKSSEVRLSVFDMLGREVAVLVDERRDAGVHEVKFESSRLSSGMYLSRLRAGDVVQSRKMMLLR